MQVAGTAEDGRHQQGRRGLHLEHRDVGCWVEANQFATVRRTVEQEHLDLPRPLDHVVVGEHMPLFVEHNARPSSLRGHLEQKQAAGHRGLGVDVRDAAIHRLVNGDIRSLFGRETAAGDVVSELPRVASSLLSRGHRGQQERRSQRHAALPHRHVRNRTPHEPASRCA